MQIRPVLYSSLYNIPEEELLKTETYNVYVTNNI
jgi:hypothetical protein